MLFKIFLTWWKSDYLLYWKNDVYKTMKDEFFTLGDEVTTVISRLCSWTNNSWACACYLSFWMETSRMMALKNKTTKSWHKPCDYVFLYYYFLPRLLFKWHSTVIQRVSIRWHSNILLYVKDKRLTYMTGNVKVQVQIHTCCIWFRKVSSWTLETYSSSSIARCTGNTLNCITVNITWDCLILKYQ